MNQSSGNPFDLNDESAYQQWRELKLSKAPTDIGEIIIEIKDISNLRKAEKAALSAQLQNCNMVIYASRQGSNEDKRTVRQLGRQFGLEHLDHNMGADDEGITELAVKEDTLHRRYIPYSNRAIRWHTDGYYNVPEQFIRGMLLHCVEPAAEGGENALLDHELAYIHLRDQNPAYIEGLMHPDAMTIPANIVEGKQIRPARSGPVFSLDQQGNLHMRYTERARSIEWKPDQIVTDAISSLLQLLHSDTRHIYRGTLQAGQGLLCNNVLHDRSKFENDAQQTRTLYRLRYYDRIVL